MYVGLDVILFREILENLHTRLQARFAHDLVGNIILFILLLTTVIFECVRVRLIGLDIARRCEITCSVSEAHNVRMGYEIRVRIGSDSYV